jgi:hypothetical protein
MLNTSTSNCMSYESRSEIVPGGSSSVEFVPVGDWIHAKLEAPSYFPPSSGASNAATYPRASQEASFEAYTPNSSGSKHQWKNFQHYKRWFNLPESGSTLASTVVNTEQWTPFVPNKWGAFHQAVVDDPFLGIYFGSGTAGEYRPYVDIPEQLFVPGQLDDSFVLPPAELESFKQRALSSMLPLVKGELSLINSIIELKDFKSLPNTLRSFGKILRILPSPKGALTLREILRTAADGYLQWKFAMQPLISDIRGIISALATSEKRINALVSRAGRMQTRHFSFSFAEYPDRQMLSNFYDNGPGGSWYPLVGANRHSRSVVYLPTEFHAEIKYTFTFTRYQVEHARLLALLDALGVNLNPAIVWNAIPWSFVVDWFLNVSSYLNNLRFANMEPLINIQSFLWSVKRVRYIDCRVSVSNKDWLGPSAWKPLPRVTEVAYRRQVGLPTHAQILSSGLNSKEFLLAAALVIARRRPRRRPKVSKKGPSDYSY